MTLINDGTHGTPASSTETPSLHYSAAYQGLSIAEQMQVLSQVLRLGYHRALQTTAGQGNGTQQAAPLLDSNLRHFYQGKLHFMEGRPLQGEAELLQYLNSFPPSSSLDAESQAAVQEFDRINGHREEAYSLLTAYRTRTLDRLRNVVDDAYNQRHENPELGVLARRSLEFQHTLQLRMLEQMERAWSDESLKLGDVDSVLAYLRTQGNHQAEAFRNDPTVRAGVAVQVTRGLLGASSTAPLLSQEQTNHFIRPSADSSSIFTNVPTARLSGGRMIFHFSTDNQAPESHAYSLVRVGREGGDLQIERTAYHFSDSSASRDEERKMIHFEASDRERLVLVTDQGEVIEQGVGEREEEFRAVPSNEGTFQSFAWSLGVGGIAQGTNEEVTPYNLENPNNPVALSTLMHVLDDRSLFDQDLHNVLHFESLSGTIQDAHHHPHQVGILERSRSAQAATNASFVLVEALTSHRSGVDEEAARILENILAPELYNTPEEIRDVEHKIEEERPAMVRDIHHQVLQIEERTHQRPTQSTVDEMLRSALETRRVALLHHHSLERLQHLIENGTRIDPNIRRAWEQYRSLKDPLNEFFVISAQSRRMITDLIGETVAMEMMGGPAAAGRSLATAGSRLLLRTLARRGVQFAERAMLHGMVEGGSHALGRMAIRWAGAEGRRRLVGRAMVAAMGDWASMTGRRMLTEGMIRGAGASVHGAVFTAEMAIRDENLQSYADAGLEEFGVQIVMAATIGQFMRRYEQVAQGVGLVQRTAVHQAAQTAKATARLTIRQQLGHATRAVIHQARALTTELGRHEAAQVLLGHARTAARLGTYHAGKIAWEAEAFQANDYLVHGLFGRPDEGTYLDSFTTVLRFKGVGGVLKRRMWGLNPFAHHIHYFEETSQHLEQAGQRQMWLPHLQRMAARFRQFAC